MSTVNPSRPYSRSVLLPDDDPVTAVARLRERFVGVPIWFGNSTRRFWAVLGGQLVEAADAAELDRVLNGARPLQPRRPMYRRTVRQPDMPPAVAPYGLGF